MDGQICTRTSSRKRRKKAPNFRHVITKAPYLSLPDILITGLPFISFATKNRSALTIANIQDILRVWSFRDVTSDLQTWNILDKGKEGPIIVYRLKSSDKIIFI